VRELLLDGGLVLGHFLLLHVERALELLPLLLALECELHGLLDLHHGRVCELLRVRELVPLLVGLLGEHVHGLGRVVELAQAAAEVLDAQVELGLLGGVDLGPHGDEANVVARHGAAVEMASRGL